MPSSRLTCARAPVQDTRSRDGRTTLLQYVARRLASAQPPHALLSEEAPAVVSSSLKTSLLVISALLSQRSHHLTRTNSIPKPCWGPSLCSPPNCGSSIALTGVQISSSSQLLSVLYI